MELRTETENLIQSQGHTLVWDGCLRTIAKRLNKGAFENWFRPVQPLKLHNSVLTIQVPSHYFYEFLEEHYVDHLREAIDIELGPHGRLEYCIAVDESRDLLRQVPFQLVPNPVRIAMPPQAEVAHHDPYANTRTPTLNPHYTFDNYVSGSCNRLARAAGLAVSDRPGQTSYNPLTIYGGVGLGKTHLMQAIGNRIKAKFPEKKVIYVSSDTFTNQFVDSLRSKDGISTAEFLQHYANADVLLLDDIQFLGDKGKTQEMFFNIFNRLQQMQKQIVMTCDCPPKDLSGIQDRLLSRLKWGLVADVSRPDFETRLAIIQQKMEADGMVLPPNIVEYLAKAVDSNVRELEGVIISIMAQSSLVNSEFDLSLCKQILHNIVADIEHEVDIDFIQKSVSEYMGISIDLIQGKTRKREVVEARQLAMYFAKEYTSYTYKTIGEFFKRDHSTVIHAVNAVGEQMETNRHLKTAIAELKKKLDR